MNSVDDPCQDCIDSDPQMDPMRRCEAHRLSYYLKDYEDKWTFRRVLVRAQDGVEICWDGGEPEDATFTRDYAPVVDELNRLSNLLSIENIQRVLKQKYYWEPNEADDLRAELLKGVNNDS